MIVFEEASFDPHTTQRRMAVLECMAKAMKVHCYSNSDALDYTLRSVVQEMRHHTRNGWPMPDGLTRIILVFTDAKAVEVVKKYMTAGTDFAACPQPDAWHQLYDRIDELRHRARKYDPDFKPRYR